MENTDWLLRFEDSVETDANLLPSEVFVASCQTGSDQTNSYVC